MEFSKFKNFTKVLKLFLNIFQKSFAIIALKLKGFTENLFLVKLNASSLVLLVIPNIQTALQKLLGNKLLIPKVFPVFDCFISSPFASFSFYES